MELAKKCVIITGSGSGIGRALAVEFARAGASIVCCGRRQDNLRETVKRVKALGGEALWVQADVTRRDQVEGVVSTALETFGSVDVLLNNAGSFGTVGGLWEVEPDAWWNDVAVNLRGTMLCCRAVLPTMMKQNQGIIITMSGGGALGPLPGGSAYGGSKAALLRLTDTLAAELARAGSSVVVLALDPGFNRTV